MRPTPRWSAYRILMDIEAQGITLDQRMDGFHQESRHDRRDEAFVTALVYGVLRWRRRLDDIIRQVATTPLARIDREVLTIVRLGLFQMLYMDRVPNAAAVHTSVELAKTLRKKWLAGFVNAVLRNALRRLEDFRQPPIGKDPVARLVVAASMPEWLVHRWIDQFGVQEAEALCRACNRIPALTLRTNTLKIDRPALLAGLGTIAKVVRPTPYTPEGICLEDLNAALFNSAAFKQGWFQVQDEAAQAVGILLAPEPGHVVLDACAGLGGKTAHMAALMGNKGQITAIERDGRKLVKLSREMQRLGIDTVIPLECDLRTLAPQTGEVPASFDRILLDAPCSGLGVIRRNPDTKWTRKQADIPRCARKQLELLNVLADRLKPGALMVYAVCSTEPEETHGVVQSFLKDRPDFGIDDARPEMPASLRPLLDHRGRLITMPHRHGTDGFFAVRLRRTQSTDQSTDDADGGT